MTIKPWSVVRGTLAWMLGASLAGVACDGTIGTPEYTPRTMSRATELVVMEEGGRLVLAGSPMDPMYRASYPNPERVGEMRVTVGATGILQKSCRDANGSMPCSETPFFSRLERVPGGLRVQLWDVYGAQVSDVVFTAPTSSETKTTEEPRPEGPDETETTEVADVPTDGPDLDPAPTESPADDGETEGAPAPDAQCQDLRLSFCNGVNTELTVRGVDMQFDCATMTDAFDPFAGASIAMASEPSTPDWECQETACPEPAPMPPTATEPCGTFIDSTQLALSMACRVHDGTADVTDAFLVLMNLTQGARQRLAEEGVCNPDPLILDLAGDGIALSAAADGVTFDLLASGRPVRTGWIRGDDAFLVLDHNGNGLVDDARELFGDLTAGRPWRHGLEALASYDDNGDGMIDARDAVFTRLQVWRDVERDGQSQPSELASLSVVGVRALSTHTFEATGGQARDAHGNELRWNSYFIDAVGTRRRIVDATLRFEVPGASTLSRR